MRCQWTSGPLSGKDSERWSILARSLRTLVTYEGSNPNSKKRVMIPDACNALGVRYCDLNTVLKEMGIKI